MPSQAEKAAAFRALHTAGEPFIMPNPWDAGSARLFETLGFKALATTSAGFALTLGRRDYGVTRDEALAHASALVGAVGIPVSADLENGFGPSPEDAAETIRLAARTGLAGGSIEDTTGDEDAPIFEREQAVERIAAAAEAARKSETGFVLTARADAFLWGEGDLDEIIARLNAFAEAGADVLFAPGLPDLAAVRAVCSSVQRPVNILPILGLESHSLQDFAEAGAARISAGSALAYCAYRGVAETASAILSSGRFDGWNAHAESAKAVRSALKDA